MKIISGLYKKRELLSPNSSKTHPMGSREKLALFNMLGFYLKNAEVLDAFSGSGALGLEALSRGAKKVIFVEKSPKVARIIKENCKTLKISPEAYEVIIKDINKIDFPSNSFDIIIADPPYDNFKIEEIERLVKPLKSNGILALSSPSTFPDKNLVLSNSEPISSHSYAAARISLFKKI